MGGIVVMKAYSSLCVCACVCAACVCVCVCMCMCLCVRVRTCIHILSCISALSNTNGSCAICIFSLVPFDEDLRDAEVWYFDHDYLENMAAMFRKVNCKHIHIMRVYFILQDFSVLLL